jgi:hypothetical protein
MATLRITIAMAFPGAVGFGVGSPMLVFRIIISRGPSHGQLKIHLVVDGVDCTSDVDVDEMSESRKPIASIPHLLES